MKSNHSISKSFSIKTLAAAIATCAVVPNIVHSAPTGGVVVDGGGAITQAGGYTQVYQTSDRLSLEWDTFNVGRNERVQFVQPGAEAIALNRILDSNGSQILGRIDANGQVILMNPNGILFGREAVVNVGGLVASGLSINSDDFMNGDLVFSGVDGTVGTVVNRGIINAALGGNIALLGKSVTNQGLISAELGHVALAAGSEAVVTFDDQGLLGVRIDQATLAEELGTAYAVNNNGTIEAKGGKILLNASVSADLFSEAVNHGGMGSNDVLFHDDGSFSIGSGNSVINSGNINVSTNSVDTVDPQDAGIAILAGENIEQRGSITANATGSDKAGAVYLNAHNRLGMTAPSRVEARAENNSGKISLEADYVQSGTGATVITTGNTYARGNLGVRLPGIATENLKLEGTGTISQASAAEVGGVTRIASAGGGNFRLVHPNNDFNLVTITTEFNDSVAIKDRNDIVLGEIEMQHSSLNVESVGQEATLRQAPESRLFVNDGNFRLLADHIILGESGASTQLQGVSLFMGFDISIATNNSIELLPYNGVCSIGRIRGMDRDAGELFLELRGDDVIDLDADAGTSSSGLNIHGMRGSNATLGGVYHSVVQDGPVKLSGSLTLNSYSAVLSHPENDVAVLHGRVDWPMGNLGYTDSNDLLLGSIVTSREASVGIASVGKGATLGQLPGTSVYGETLYLAADNIIIRGAVAGSVLVAEFKDRMVINGGWGAGTYERMGPFIRITGDDGDNTLIFGERTFDNSFAGSTYYGQLDIDLKGGNDTVVFTNPYLISGDPDNYTTTNLKMGDGDDRVVFLQDVQIPLTLGAGNDVLRLGNSLVEYDVLDFDPNEDRLVITTP
ncbi:MAG: filamentous hemagglutinin N-terminal domain-containing protein [Cellvibrionaceae bacterium]|nr:filamentous hemagglutinin N-terminal domain-containing protein [Cellvibrionaceae bacterium]